MPTAHLAWVQEILGENGVVQAGFASIPTVTAGLPTFGRTRTYGEAGIGADIDVAAFLGTPGALTVRYNTTLGREDVGYNSWMGHLNLRF